MKYLKMLGLAAVAAMATMAFTAGSASANVTLELTGVPTSNSVSITASLASGTSAVLKDTEGFSANTCTVSNVAGKTESNLTTAPTGKLSSLTFESCTRPVTVHQPGSLEITTHTGTNGTVWSEKAQVTVGSPFGTLNCVTGDTTHIGTLTGSKHNHAVLHINAVINCGFFIPTANWNATYTVTSPTGLGVHNTP